MILTLVKFVGLAFVTFLYEWTTDPVILAISGFVVTLFIAWSRIFVTRKSLENFVSNSTRHLQSIRLSMKTSLEYAKTKQIRERRDRRQMFQHNVRIQSILSDIKRGVIMVNSDMSIKVINRVALDMFGYKRDAWIVGRPLSMLIPSLGETPDIESGGQEIEIVGKSGKDAFESLGFLNRRIHVGIEKSGKEFTCSLFKKEKNDSFLVLFVDLAAMPSRISRQLGSVVPDEDLQKEEEEEAPVKVIRVQSNPELKTLSQRSYGLG